MYHLFTGDDYYPDLPREELGLMTPQQRTTVLMKLHRIGSLATRSRRLSDIWTPEQDLAEITALYEELTAPGSPLDPYEGHRRECQIRFRGSCTCTERL